MKVRPTVLLAELPVLTLLPDGVSQMPFQTFKNKKKNPSLKRDCVL